MGRAFSFGPVLEIPRKSRSVRSEMDEFKFFKNFKERGEWVEPRSWPKPCATATKS